MIDSDEFQTMEPLTRTEGRRTNLDHPGLWDREPCKSWKPLLVAHTFGREAACGKVMV